MREGAETGVCDFALGVALVSGGGGLEYDGDKEIALEM